MYLMYLYILRIFIEYVRYDEKIYIKGLYIVMKQGHLLIQKYFLRVSGLIVFIHYINSTRDKRRI